MKKASRAVYENSKRIRKPKHTFLSSFFNCRKSQGQSKWPEVKRERETEKMNVWSRILSALEDYITSGQEKYRLFLSASGNAHAG